MLLNELAQWAVLAFMGVFLLGLTRQLGNFLVPNRERVANDTGPRVGKRLSSELLPTEALDRLRTLIAESGRGWGSILIVSEDCPGCDGLIDRIAREGSPQQTPVAIISRTSSEPHRSRLERVGDVVVVDKERLKAAHVGVTPFAFLVDGSLKILHKQIAFDLSDVVHNWLENGRRKPPEMSSNGRPETTNGNGRHPEPLSLTHVGGGGE